MRVCMYTYNLTIVDPAKQMLGAIIRVVSETVKLVSIGFCGESGRDKRKDLGEN